MSYFLFMQRKYKAGSLSEEDWKKIENNWKEFEYRWNLHLVDESTYLKPKEDFESIEDFDEELQSLLRWLWIPKKRKSPDTNIQVFDSDKKLAQQMSKFRKQQEFNEKYSNEYHHWSDKFPWLHDYKLPKPTGKILSTRHDDIHRTTTACYFRRNYKTTIPLLLYFESLDTNKNELLIKLERQTGIYLLINNVNNKIYVGSSSNLSQRMKHYIGLSINNNFKTVNERPIVKAINKYGLEKFSLGILMIEPQSVWMGRDNWKKLLLDLEQGFINAYKPEYNHIKALKVLLED
jgi:hypothetical protein